MRKLLKLTPILMALAAGPGLADEDGDPVKGEADFKKCRACHAIIAPDETVIQKGGKTAPNLFGLIGRPIGGLPDFKYGASIVAAGAAGLVWDQEMLEEYVSDPAAFLKEVTGDAAAKSAMTFKLTKGAEDMAAYLATLN